MSLLKKLRSEKFRWLQRITGVHAVHDILYSFGLKMPFTSWVYFLPSTYKVDQVFRPDYGAKKIRPGHWKRRTPDSYHDMTATGRY